MLRERYKEPVVVGGADAEVGIPVRRSNAIVRALRVADGDAFVGGDGGPSGVVARRPCGASVAVQHEHQRRPCGQFRWEVEVIGALDPVELKGLFDLGLGSEKS